MKKIFILFSFTLLTACGPAFNSLACRQAVMEEMKTTDVLNLEGSKYKFLVRTEDGAVWIVETMNGSSPKITLKTLIFKAKE